MKRRKHKKDYKKKKENKNLFQGYLNPPNKILRKMIDGLEVKSGSMFKKIGGWFEWN